MRRMTVVGGVALALAGLPAIAQAAPAFITQPVNMRAGPDAGYPVVAVLQPGVQVNLSGCIDGWSWCDVNVNGYRGWVYGSYLQLPYQNRQVPIIGFGGQVGVPIITFSFGSYWDNHYRGQPWYNDRDRYLGYQPRYQQNYPGRGPGYNNGHGPQNPNAYGNGRPPQQQWPQQQRPPQQQQQRPPQQQQQQMPPQQQQQQRPPQQQQQQQQRPPQQQQGGQFHQGQQEQNRPNGRGGQGQGLGQGPGQGQGPGGQPGPR